jgi:hypothetical protein
MTRTPTRGLGAARGLAILSAAVIVAAFGLAGCQAISNLYLTPFTGGAATAAPSTAESVGCDASVDGQVEYSAGHASIVLVNGPTDTVVLDAFGDGMFVPDQRAQLCGEASRATWTSDDGTWTLFVGAFPPDGTGTSRIDVSIEYQSAGASYGADATCPASNTEADAAGLAGVAHCTDLTWASDPAQTPAPSSAFTRGFDATITFEARP